MTNAEKYKQEAGKVLAVRQLVGPLIVKEIVSHLLNGHVQHRASKGEVMCTLKARDLAKAIDWGVHMAENTWNSVFNEKFDTTVRNWNLDTMTYRATGRNQFLKTMQNVSQLLTEKGFEVDFSWEVVREYVQFQHEKPPESNWGTEYEHKRTITIYKTTRQAYPELGLPESEYRIHKQFDKTAWMQVRPAFNIRWGSPSEEEIQELADKFLYEITSSDRQKALDEALTLDSDDRMLRIGFGTPTRDSYEA